MANPINSITDFLSGGQMADALERLADSSSVISEVDLPDLADLIPELQLQVQQGKMTAAQAQAATARVVGIMSPSRMAAALTTMQGKLQPAQMTAARALVQGVMEPAKMEAVNAVVQGRMTPARADAAMQSSSNMRNVNSDQASISGQRQALSQLADIGKNQGMTEADRAQFASTMAQTNANAAQQRAAQIQQLQMQGNAGSGAELAARLSGTQGAANSNAAAGADVAKSAQARALQAIQAGLAGNANLNTNLFSQAAQKAQAQDTINAFNTGARNTMNLANANNLQNSNLANFNTANTVAANNQAAQNAARTYNATNTQNANLSNFNAAQTAALANAGYQQAANATNAANTQAANTQNFLTANQVAQLNQANTQFANQYNATNQQNANTTNFNAAQTAALANAGYQQATSEANANRNTNANLANFNMANSINATNTGITNTQRMMPYNAAQANFTNALNQGVAASTADYRAGGVMADLAGKQMTNTINGVTGFLNSPTGQAATGLVRNAAGELGKVISGVWTKLTADEAANWAGSGLSAADIDSVGGSTGGGNFFSDAWDTVSDWFSDEKLKTDKKELNDADIDKIMGHMTGYKYRYKGAKTNPTQVGVMAQDMPGESVIDTPSGKMIQGDSALNQALAVLANQHARIKKLEQK